MKKDHLLLPPRGPDVDWRLKVFKEHKIRQLLKARVEAYGGEVRAVSWLGRRNAPDVLCLFTDDSLYATAVLNERGFYSDKDLHPWVEAKRPKKDATAAQAREHERMQDAGCVVMMVRDISELDAWLPPL